MFIFKKEKEKHPHVDLTTNPRKVHKPLPVVVRQNGKYFNRYQMSIFRSHTNSTLHVTMTLNVPHSRPICFGIDGPFCFEIYGHFSFGVYGPFCFGTTDTLTTSSIQGLRAAMLGPQESPWQLPWVI